MSQTIKIKRSSDPGKVPASSELELGELAINTYDGKIFFKRDDGTESIVNVTGETGNTGQPAGSLYNIQMNGGGNSFAAIPNGTDGYILTAHGNATPTWEPAPATGVTSVAVSGGTTGLTTSGGPITGAGTITLGGTLAIANGGTGATTAGAALTALLPSQTGNNGRVLSTDGTTASWIAPPAAGVTSVQASGGTTGMTFSGGPITSSGTLTMAGTLAIANGGTGATTAANAINALVPSQTGNSGRYLTTNGTVVSWSAAAPGTVTSVQGSGGTTGLTFSGGPITTTGTLTLGGTLAVANGGTGSTTQSGAINNLLPAQSGQGGKVLTTDGSAVSWTTASAGTVTSVAIDPSTTGLTFAGGPITSSGTFTVGGTLAVANGGTGATTANSALNALLPSQTGNSGRVLSTNGTDASWIAAATGTVTSVAVSGGTTGLTTSGGPVTTSGTITLAGTLALANGGTGATTQAGAANAVLPSQTGNSGRYLTTNGTNVSWSAAAPGTVTSVQASGGTTGLTFSGGPVTTSGTLTLSGTLALANGGTGATTQAGAANAVLPSQSTFAGQFLTTDGTNVSWAMPSASATSLNGIGTTPRSATTAGVYAGIDGGSDPIVTLSNPAAGVDGGVFQMYVIDNGSLNLGFSNDAYNQTNFLTVTRPAASSTASNITFAATAMQINAPVTATSFSGVGTNLTALNASNVSSGTLAIANGGTGQTTASGAINALVPSQTGNSGRVLGTNGTAVSWVAASAGTVTSVAASGGTTGLTFSGSPITTSGTLTLSGTLALANGGTGATTQAGAANAVLPSQTSAAGQFLTTNGTNVSWATVSATTLGATGISPRAASGSTSGIYAGIDTAPNNDPTFTMVSGDATTGNKVSQLYIVDSGQINWGFCADNFSGQTNFLTVGRSSGTNNASTITLTSTAFQVNAALTATSLAGSGTGITALSASNISTGVIQDPLRLATTGTPSSSTYLRGDLSWQPISSAGTVTSVQVAGGTTGLTFSGGPITTSGTITMAGTLAIANGGTGQTTASGAINALVPSQTGNAGLYLTTNGTSVSWAAASATASNIPRVTTFDINARGARVALTADVTVNSGVFAVGDVISFYNTTASTLQLIQGSGMTGRLDGTANTGTRTIQPFGVCYIWFNTTTEYIVSGSVL